MTYIQIRSIRYMPCTLNSNGFRPCPGCSRIAFPLWHSTRRQHVRSERAFGRNVLSRYTPVSLAYPRRIFARDSNTHKIYG